MTFAGERTRGGCYGPSLRWFRARVAWAKARSTEPTSNIKINRMSVAIASAFALTRFGGQVAQTTPAPSFFPAILRRSTQRGRAMLYLVLKAGLSGVIIAAASELARRAPALGALILSLPLVSLLAFIWLWGDGGDNARIAALSEVDVLVCAADAADVPRAAGAVAPRRRLLDGDACLLRADLRAIFADGLGPRQIRLHPLSGRST